MVWISVQRCCVIFAVMTTVNGCSYIATVDVMETKAQSMWEKITPCHSYLTLGIDEPAHAFDTLGVALSVCSQPTGGREILFGPPLIPVIPNPFSLFGHSDRDYSISLRVECPKGQCSLDMTSIRCRFNDFDSSSTPTVFFLKSSHSLHTWDDNDNVRAREGKSTYHIILDRDTTTLLLVFPIPVDNVDNLVLDIGTLTIGGRRVDVPPLVLSKDRFWKYNPLQLFN